MENKDILNKLKGHEYDFLRKNKRLGNNIILLVLGGSRAYGTDDENSDIDIRGIALDCKEDLHGRVFVSENNPYEIFENSETDTVIYTLSKFIELAAKGNPNILEMLGVREEDILYVTPLGRKILDNKHLFYSKKAVYSLGGFGEMQLRRMENAIAHDRVPQARREEHLQKSIERFLTAAKGMFTPYGEGDDIKLRIKKSDKEEYDTEIFIDLNFTDYPLRDLRSIIKEMTDICRTYDTLGHRNSKKDDYHINKHAMHLVRLYLMGIEFIETGELHTRLMHEEDIELLKSIKRGEFMLEDGSYDKSFFSILDELKTRYSKAIEHCILPEHCNIEALSALKQELLMYQFKSKKKPDNSFSKYFGFWFGVPVTNMEKNELISVIPAYDKLYDSVHKFAIYQNALKEKGSLDALIEFDRMMVNKMADTVSQREPYKNLMNMSEDEFVKMLDSKWTIPKGTRFAGSKKHPYNRTNAGKKFLSVDLVSAHFQVLNLIDKDILKHEDYEEFAMEFLKDEGPVMQDMFKYSKQSREYFSGKLNPKKIERIEKHVTKYVYSKLMKFLPELKLEENTVSLLHDEIIIKLCDDIDYDRIRDMIEEISNNTGIKLHVNIYTLEKYPDKDWFIKFDTSGSYSPVCVPKESILEVIEYAERLK